MAEQAERQSPDIMEIWREWLTQSERQFNAFFNDAMNNESFARGMGNYVELTAGFQRVVTDGMQRYLEFMNLPSRTDVVSLGESLRNIENRLARIEEMLQIAAAAVDEMEQPAPPRHEPLRTRRPPPDFPFPVEERVEAPQERGDAFPQERAAVPEELRR